MSPAFNARRRPFISRLCFTRHSLRSEASITFRRLTPPVGATRNAECPRFDNIRAHPGYRSGIATKHAAGRHRRTRSRPSASGAASDRPATRVSVTVSSPFSPIDCQEAHPRRSAATRPCRRGLERWIRSKLWQITARTPSSRVPFAAQSRDEPLPYSAPAKNHQRHFLGLILHRGIVDRHLLAIGPMLWSGRLPEYFHRRL